MAGRKHLRKWQQASRSKLFHNTVIPYVAYVCNHLIPPVAVPNALRGTEPDRIREGSLCTWSAGLLGVSRNRAFFVAAHRLGAQAQCADMLEQNGCSAGHSLGTRGVIPEELLAVLRV
jgi:hypothetical protein